MATVIYMWREDRRMRGDRKISLQESSLKRKREKKLLSGPTLLRTRMACPLVGQSLSWGVGACWWTKQEKTPALVAHVAAAGEAVRTEPRGQPQAVRGRRLCKGRGQEWPRAQGETGVVGVALSRR